MNPALEDPVYYLQRERQLPINVDPLDNRLENPEERERVRQRVRARADTPTRWCLPLQRGPGRSGPEWQTGLWMLRGQHLFLVPGDSPVGLRLPLPGLPWVAAVRRAAVFPRGSDGPARVPCRFHSASSDATAPRLQSRKAPNGIASLPWASPLRGWFGRRCA